MTMPASPLPACESIQQTVHTRFEARSLRLFVSSPGDVQAERDRVEWVVHRYHQERIEVDHTFLKVLRWERMPPRIGPTPQATIDNEVDMASVDIFLGIMWDRFGGNKGGAGSGTEQEFEAALASYREIGSPWIVFYFAQKPSILKTREEVEQRDRVISFRDRISPIGLVREYRDGSEFERVLYRDLQDIVARIP